MKFTTEQLLFMIGHEWMHQIMLSAKHGGQYRPSKAQNALIRELRSRTDSTDCLYIFFGRASVNEVGAIVKYADYQEVLCSHPIDTEATKDWVLWWLQMIEAAGVSPVDRSIPINIRIWEVYENGRLFYLEH